MIHALVTLIRKELQALLSSPMGRRMLFMPVVLQLVLFPLAATLEVKNSTLAVFNQDGGTASTELVQRLAAAKAFPTIIDLYSEKEVRETIDRQRALLVVWIPNDFSRKLERGQPGVVQALIDGRRSNSAQIAYGYAAQVVTGYAAERLGRPLPASLVVQNLYNPNLEYQWFVLPSLVAIITTVGCLIITALSVAREREEGTFDQLLVSPLTPAYIMAGKAIPGILVAMVQGTIIIISAVFLYRVPFGGSALVLYGAMVCYGFALAGCGLLISAFCNSQQQAFLGTFGFMSPAVILSGYMAPVENMPLPLRWISAVDPLTHFIIVVKGIFLKGYGLSQAWPHIWPLMAIGLVNMGIAYVLFRNRSGQ
ncbi:MAG TPA: ABC transporter permease [Burkholderiaceae bacterium]